MMTAFSLKTAEGDPNAPKALLLLCSWGEVGMYL